MPDRPAFESFSAVIEAFGDRFAEAIGIEPSHARTIKARGSIPSHRWNAVVKAAAKENIPGVTLELLASLEEQRSKTRRPDAEPAAQGADQ